MFGLGYVEGTAKVVQRRKLSDRTRVDEHGGSHRYVTVELIVDVQPADGGDAFRATFKDKVHQSQVGETIPVKYHPKSHKVKLDFDRLHHTKEKKAARKAQKAKNKADDGRWEATKNAAPGSAPAPRRD